MSRPTSLLKPIRLRLSICVSLLLVVTMLSQMMFVAPVQSAGFSPLNRVTSVVDTSSPAQPYVIGGVATSGFTSSVASLLAFATGTTKTETPVEELPVSQPALSGGEAELAAVRLQPGNATGGTNLYSRNFAWGTSLAGLPGRAGLDAGFGISYNSLVWAKDAANSRITFDPDNGNVSPGFQFGFPRIEQPYQDLTYGDWRFLMVNPDGSRSDFRQVDTSAVFETGDSSYRKLEINDVEYLDGSATRIDITVTSTDGTRIHFVYNNGSYRCYEIKDRNGNYISIDYNSYGRMTGVTDTLGRVITINYDTGGYPTTITQTWKDTNGSGSNTTHTWATLSYTNATVSTSFSGGLTVIGPSNSSTVKVLEKITYADSSFTKFEYNGYIQVKKISQVAADSTSHVLNYVSTNLDSVSGTQSDCPRLSETRSWVENFNLSGGTPQEVVVTNSLTTGATYSLPNSISGSATRIDVAMTGHPDGLYSRTYVGASGYKEGLTLATEDCTGTNCATRLRWTWTDWTQDNTSASYITNPRVVESRVGDGTNTKRTTVDYGTNSFGLPQKVKVYDTDLSTVLKTQTTSYNLTSTYTSRRIIGLPVETMLWEGVDGSGTLMSKVTYDYDEGNMTGTDPVQNISPVGHDNTNYSSSFVVGRGNLTHVSRWDVLDDVDPIEIATYKYNTAGAVVSKTTPWTNTTTRTVKISYTDNFNSSPGVSTYAYPTTLTDPNAQSSTVKYRYDIGANIEATSPAPAGQTYGKTSKRIYDSVGRLERDSIYVNTTEKSYVRYEFPTNGIQSVSYAPIVDVDGDNNIAEDEVLSESWFDGAGRVRRSRTEHPGSTGGWSASQIEYDILGRTYRTSVPTEISVSGTTWTAAGDDSTRGWIWNYSYYDWKGRTVRTVPSDSTGSDGKDTLISYAGCGCAGGMTTTVEGPSVPRDDYPNLNARRKQKVTEDILGRTVKSETFAWDGTTVYSTIANTYDGRDQVTLSRQYAGTTSSSTYQDTTVTYDGHGRVASQHVPQQSSNTATIFSYYPDDRLHVKTDARGATTTLAYDNRGLLTSSESEFPNTTNQSVRRNYAYALNGGTATASSYYTGRPPIAAINGDRIGNNGGWWMDATYLTYPDWLEVDLGTERTIDEIDVISLQDNYQTAGQPTETTTGMYVPAGLDVQYWTGSAWTNVPNGSITGNDKVWKKFQFSSITTSKIRVQSTGPGNTTYNPWSNIVELEAWGNEATPPVNTETTYTYDNLGNRTSMTDDNGSTSYEYNSLSQMLSETRGFNGPTLANAPLSGNHFKLEYSYNLSGALKSLKDPYGDEIDYGYDKAGRLDEVNGSTFDGITGYADNAAYRAWGGLKGLTYGNGATMSTTFNDKLQPNHYELNKNSTSIMKKNYEYYTDGSMKYLQDQLNDKFDRLNIYDNLGRIKQAKSGLEARGGTVTTSQNTDLPYRQSYTFNQFGNMTQRNNLHWGIDNWYGLTNNLSYTYQNDRITNTGWTYDADGRVLASAAPDEVSESTYDASGRLSTLQTYDPNTFYPSFARRFYDGDGHEVRRERRTYVDVPVENQDPIQLWKDQDPIYYIRSTVLGGVVVSETQKDGAKKKTYVNAAGARIATQSQYMVNSTLTKSVSFEHFDASGMSYRSTDSSGNISSGDGQFDGGPAEMDPMGGNMGTETPYLEEPLPPPNPTSDFPFFPMIGDAPMYVNGQRVTCSLDGMAIGCSHAMQMLEGGAALPAALAPYQNRPGFQFNSYGLGLFSASWRTWTPGQWTDSNVRILDGPNDGLTTGPPPQWNPGHWTKHSGFFSVSWGVSLRWNDDCKPGKPCPKPHPTPTPKGGQGREGLGRGRDCNQEAGLSGSMAVSQEAADLIIATADSEGVSDTALAVTMRFETGFYQTTNAAPNPNYDKNGVASPITGWDYGPFHTNYADTQSKANRGLFRIDDIPKAYGTLGAANFDGSPSDNAKLAARMLRANGGGEENQVKWYAGVINMPRRLQDYKTWGPSYRKFFECWRATH